MRLLVCGGRDFCDVPLLWSILDGIDSRADGGIKCVIDGKQQKVLPDGRIVGADYWAHQWALARHKPSDRFPADWATHGRAAGPKRNQWMFNEGKPTHGLAMPGGKGTAGMVRIMKAGGIPVWEVR